MGCEEPISITGYLHIAYKTWTDDSGAWHYHYHLNGKGSGLGWWTENEYRWSESWNISDHGDVLQFPYWLTRIHNRELVSTGDAPNLLERLRHHITINANGELTAEFERGSDMKIA